MKNKIKTLLITMMLLLSVVLASAQTSELTSDLQVYYAFENDISDSSPNSNDGIAITGTTFSTGKLGTALNVSSGGVFNWTSNLADYTGSEATVCAWIDPPAGNWYTFVSVSGVSTLSIGLATAGNTIGYYDGSAWRSSSQDFDEAGAFHHVCWVFNGTVFDVFYDGVEVDSDIGYNGNLDFSQGMSTGRNGGTDFEGLLDEAGIWNKTLSASAISTLYNNGTGLTYPFTLEEETTQTFTYTSGDLAPSVINALVKIFLGVGFFAVIIGLFVAGRLLTGRKPLPDGIFSSD